MAQQSKYPSASVELQVESLAQLFDHMDPFPFRERDLDGKAEQYIFGWARDAETRDALTILIHLPRKEAESSEAQHVAEAFHRHFDYCANRASQDLRQLFRQGRYAIGIGAAVLTSTILLRQILLTVFPYHPAIPIVAESLLIVGWVANWRPLEIFLYDWLPIAQTRRLYRRLAKAPVLLRAIN